jgi:peptidyl-prolyl cis-trans isomerase A (cyclophilin A)
MAPASLGAAAMAVAVALAAVAAPAPSPARVLLRTEQGPIELLVDTVRAPTTAANFLRYVEAGRYDGGVFHRTVRLDNQPGQSVLIEVVQASAAPGGPDFEPIPLERTNETGLRHVDGALSMARDAPDSATSDFFICIGDQPELDFGGKRNRDGQGFAAFGRVVRGLEVVRAIQGSPADGQHLTPPVKIVSARVLGSKGP